MPHYHQFIHIIIMVVVEINDGFVEYIEAAFKTLEQTIF